MVKKILFVHFLQLLLLTEIFTLFMKKILFAILLMMPVFLNAQETNKIVFDSVRNREILIDIVSDEGLQAGEFGESYAVEYKNYSPSKGSIRKLQKQLQNIEIVLVLATWCRDSKEQVPRFLKILDQVNFDFKNLSMIAVDSKKNGQKIDVSSFDIQRVPTFIFFRDEIEIGRIIETPHKTLEKDLLKII